MINKENEIKKAINNLKKIKNCNDNEMAHIEADNIIMNLIETLINNEELKKELSNAYNNIDKWYA